MDAGRDVGAVIMAARSGIDEDRAACAGMLRKKYLPVVDPIFGSHEGSFVLGEQLSICHIFFYGFHKIVEEKYFPFLDSAVFDGYQNLQQCFDALSSNAKVMEWEDAHGNE